MRKLSAIFLASMLTWSTAQATGMKCGAGKCGGSMASEKIDTKLLSDFHRTDTYAVHLMSHKALAVGNNEVQVLIEKDGKPVTNAKVKVKFFMPEMPGMPYMEYKEKFKLEDTTYKGVVNFSMGGTWQYHLKFKTADEKVHKVRGSVNL